MTKIARSGAEGNTRLLAKYGGGSEPPRQSYPKGYATGGIVKGDNPALAEGMGVAGTPAKASTSRPGRKMPGRAGKGKDAKKAGTSVNVIIVPKGDDKGMPPAMKDAGGPPMPPPGPMAGPPPPMPPGPMAGPGGSGGPPLPMPMRKHGGRVQKADGGRISDDSKAEVDRLSRERQSDAGSAVGNTALAGVVGALNRLPGGGRVAKGLGYGLTGANLALAARGAKGVIDKTREINRIEKGMATPGEEDRKNGGRVHDDAAKDKAATKAAVHKHEKVMHPGKPMTKLAAGGPALTGFDAGAGGGKGRLEKAKKYGK